MFLSYKVPESTIPVPPPPPPPPPGSSNIPVPPPPPPGSVKNSGAQNGDKSSECLQQKCSCLKSFQLHLRCNIFRVEPRGIAEAEADQEAELGGLDERDRGVQVRLRRQAEEDDLQRQEWPNSFNHKSWRQCKNMSLNLNQNYHTINVS